MGKHDAIKDLGGDLLFRGNKRDLKYRKDGSEKIMIWGAETPGCATRGPRAVGGRVLRGIEIEGREWIGSRSAAGGVVGMGPGGRAVGVEPRGGWRRRLMKEGNWSESVGCES